jgi:hypothetical protein
MHPPPKKPWAKEKPQMNPVSLPGCAMRVAFPRLIWLFLVSTFLLVAVPVSAVAQASQEILHVSVMFSGGHETYGPDRGRPVVLIAAALGVPAEVFREAFSHVHPAGPGQSPQEPQVRANKAALMAALTPYGVTDDRLNAVSNHYRYVRSRGEMWPVRAATAYALVASGVVTGFVITDGGTGYSSPPTVTVPGVSGLSARAQLAFGADFEHNGAVTSITLAHP